MQSARSKTLKRKKKRKKTKQTRRKRERKKEKKEKLASYDPHQHLTDRSHRIFFCIPEPCKKKNTKRARTTTFLERRR